MRFSDETKISEFLSAVGPVMERLLARDEMTRGQECLGAACAFAQTYPDSQTAHDLLAWAHGSTPGACIEQARAETIEEWIAPEDVQVFEMFSAAVS